MMAQCSARALLMSLLMQVFGSTAQAQAQSPPLPPMSTDRPDVTESTAIVGRGVLQLEGGVLLASSGSASATLRTLMTPAVLLRIGLLEQLEVRVDGDGLIWQWAPSSGFGTRTRSTSDISVGAKYKFLSQETGPLDLAILPALSVPVGSADVSSNAVDPELTLAWGRDLAAGFGLTGNVSLLSTSSTSNSADRSWQQVVTASFDRDLGRGWGGFWEVYGVFADQDGSDQTWTFDAGVVRPLGNWIQIDASAGVGIARHSPGWFVSAGVSGRGRLFR